MSNLVMWNLIIGFLAPNIIALIQQPGLSKGARAVITAVFSVIAGSLTAYFNGGFNFSDVVGSILTVGVAAITFYKGFFKPTGIAPGIEHATSRTPTYRNDRGAANDRMIYLVAAVLVIVVCAIWILTWLAQRL